MKHISIVMAFLFLVGQWAYADQWQCDISRCLSVAKSASCPQLVLLDSGVDNSQQNIFFNSFNGTSGVARVSSKGKFLENLTIARSMSDLTVSDADGTILTATSNDGGRTYSGVLHMMESPVRSAGIFYDKISKYNLLATRSGTITYPSSDNTPEIFESYSTTELKASVICEKSSFENTSRN